METLSLWKQLRTHGLDEGKEREGFIGVYLPVNPRLEPFDRLKRIVISVTTTKQRRPYRFVFREWEHDEGQIFDVRWK